MFEALAVHSRIAVTGPQRSGTTIAGKMIAHDTGHRYVDETDFGIYDHNRWETVLKPDRVVVQCPHMLRSLVDDPPPGVLVVLTRRSLEEIHASERRIAWETWYKGNSAELAVFGLSEGDSAKIKYEYWDSHPTPPLSLEIHYDSLSRHSLYIDPELRSSFSAKQTAPTET